MKDKYLKPQVEIEKFRMVEILTVSGPTDDNDEKFEPENLFA